VNSLEKTQHILEYKLLVEEMFALN